MTPPPRKYAEAPATASSAAEMRPPAEDSATARVCLRSLSSAPSAAAIERSFGMARMIPPERVSALARQRGDVDEGPERVWMARPGAERRGHGFQLRARREAVLDKAAPHGRGQQPVGVGVTPRDRVVGRRIAPDGGADLQIV